nr:hypothetical protein [Natrinema salaciae]
MSAPYSMVLAAIWTFSSNRCFALLTDCPEYVSVMNGTRSGRFSPTVRIGTPVGVRKS